MLLKDYKEETLFMEIKDTKSKIFIRKIGDDSCEKKVLFLHGNPSSQIAFNH